MRQPVLLDMSVPDGTSVNDLGRKLERQLRGLGWDVKWAIPVQRTDGVPAGMISHE